MTEQICCPQCGEESVQIGRYVVERSGGQGYRWTYYFRCCGEPVESWGYTSDWAESRMQEQGATA